ncbi:hypothetical protein [Leptospira alexanderi]|uniref:hypothetical protein n=1 Tax=Leptospira alexanderi TaxID=100053 RepID=UPI000990D404|nr:hypothetical protein [Leptospira alexanderi]
MIELFDKIIKTESEECERILPSDPTERIVLLIESFRVIDYLTFLGTFLPKESHSNFPDFSITLLGFNALIERCISEFPNPGMPFMESTKATQDFAFNVLYKFGKLTLLKQTKDSIMSGYAEAINDNNSISIRFSKDSLLQHLDTIDVRKLQELTRSIEIENADTLNGWKLVDHENIKNIINEPGAFSAKSPKIAFLLNAKISSEQELDELMKKHLSPWNSGKGIMVSYTSEPIIEDHFFSLGIEIVLAWRTEAGFSPYTKFDIFDGGDISIILAIVIGFQIKHMRYCLIASLHHPEINIIQSLTIWKPIEELIELIMHRTHFDRDKASSLLNCVILKPSDLELYSNNPTPTIPPLINLGNDYIITPISGSYRNPFLSIITILNTRNPSFKDSLLKPRENWFREELYSIFGGKRYITVSGNVNLRENRNIITDIDAAIFDLLTGELAIFQLKWQDYFSNEVRSIKSKAKNLTEELDHWAEKVETWLKGRKDIDILNAFRISNKQRIKISRIYLFALSRNVSRIEGHRLSLKSPNLVISNWFLFTGLRHEIGPNTNVFGTLFKILKNKTFNYPNITAINKTIKIQNYSITWENMWVTYKDSEDKEIDF